MDNAPNIDTLRAVQQAFEALRGEGGPDKLDVLRELLARLNYRVVAEELPAVPRDAWSRAMADAVPAGSAGPVIIASGGGRALRLDFGEDSDALKGFVVIYCMIRAGDTVPLRLTDERAMAQQVLRDERWPNCLLVFSDPEQRHWHFVSPRRLTRARAEGRAQRHVLRRIAVGPGDRLRTAIDRFARIRLEPAQADTMPAAEIHRQHDIAFSVEQVTEDFFDQFKQHYFKLEDCLVGQVDDRPWAHDFALRLLSRLMFIYFIQRKRWIADNPEFMAHYWQRYLHATGGGDDSFYQRWLHPLFFQAFQDPGTAAAILQLDYMPEDLRQALRNAPYLNGGLFAEAELDREHAGDFVIPDSYFDSLLHPSEDLAADAGFLERYNFTISEDSPLDQEVAVDPEMIGRVYESLVNISEPGADTAGDRERQRAAGIFYTPRTEIDLMCRLALSDYLCNHLGEEHRDLIYQLTFSLEPDEKHEADAAVAREDLWPRIAELLEAVTVVDPACGSGSFLVGMMNILADLRQRANDFTGRNPTPYELNRDIIRTSLYGVDVMEWACHVAELRLWLQLMIHADPKPGELRGVRPLLPNLSFKIRQGDSLVQELGEVNLAHLKADADIERQTRSELRRLQTEKQRFYDAMHQDEDREANLHTRERNLFLRICREKAQALDRRIAAINRELAEKLPTLEGQVDRLTGRERERREAERDDLTAQKRRLEEARTAVGNQQQLPFVWDLAFVEIF
ncbi:MAG: DNA methyltransferase, partial [Armatimonadota bacterium]